MPRIRPYHRSHRARHGKRVAVARLVPDRLAKRGDICRCVGFSAGRPHALWRTDIVEVGDHVGVDDGFDRLGCNDPRGHGACKRDNNSLHILCTLNFKLITLNSQLIRYRGACGAGRHEREERDIAPPVSAPLHRPRSVCTRFVHTRYIIPQMESPAPEKVNYGLLPFREPVSRAERHVALAPLAAPVLSPEYPVRARLLARRVAAQRLPMATVFTTSLTP